MRALYICTLVLAVAALATAGRPSWAGKSRGQSSATITFVDNRQQKPRPWNRRPQVHVQQPLVDPQPPHGQPQQPVVDPQPPQTQPQPIVPSGGGNIQFGETSATSVQTSTGDGGQENRGSATGISVQQQSGLGGATQITNNQALIEAAQQATGGAGGAGSSQTSNNQVNINSQQTQQNVEGTLVNVQAGNKGVVVVNTNDPTGAVVEQQVINNKPVGERNEQSARCRYVCIRPFNKEPYCCDNGSNTRGDPNEIHGGKCPGVRVLCDRNKFFQKCAHDGQCAPSDKCCYDTCIQHHICKSADP